MTRIEVLDKGYVRLADSMGSDLSIVRAARVSYDADWRAGQNEASDEKLLAYLIKNHHSTPFEAVTMTFEVKAPIFVYRQWHRHRTWSYNELSARYAPLPDEFYVPLAEHIGQQDPRNKQARIIGEAPKTRNDEIQAYVGQCEGSFRLYNELLNKGWPRELARMCLPVSTYSRMFATVNLLNLLRFLELRMDEHAQFEIRQYADALCRLASTIVPITMKHWSEMRSGQKT